MRNGEGAFYSEVGLVDQLNELSGGVADIVLVNEHFSDSFLHVLEVNVIEQQVIATYSSESQILNLRKIDRLRDGLFQGIDLHVGVVQKLLGLRVRLLAEHEDV